MASCSPAVAVGGDFAAVVGTVSPRVGFNIF